MTKFLKIFSSLILALALAACTTAGKKTDKRNMYAENPNLITPQELSNFKTEDYYPIPKLPRADGRQSVNEAELVYPPGSGLGSEHIHAK